MIRLTALNDETSRSSEEGDVHPKEPPQEVQEENALKLYNEALKEQGSGNVDKAESLYKQLLSSNFIINIKPDEDSLKIKKADSVFNLYSKPGLMLKYSCLKNLAVLSQKKNLLSEALEFYNQALEVEGTDVSMWFQSGCIAMKMFSIRAALEAFVKGLEFSPNHWPSLDKLIICLFILHDYVNCLHYISRAFAIDVNYTRGQVLRDYIITEQPSLQNLHFDLKSEATEEINKRLLNEVLDISKEYIKKCREDIFLEKREDLFTPPNKMTAATWINLGESILRIEEELTSQEYVTLTVPINLKGIIEEAQLSSEKNEVPLQTNDGAEGELNLNKSKEDENVKKTSDTVCEKKSKKNKGSALMEELLWGGKRRSARVRSSLRGNPEPMDVAEALRRILPRRLLHRSKQAKSENFTKEPSLGEDSLDTMDLYKLFERQESLEEKKQKEEQERCEIEQDIEVIVESEGYFGKKGEADDVHSFVCNENEKNIIELIKSYVVYLTKHWEKTWPNALPGIYIKCYQLMRKHYPIDFKMCTTESNFKSLVEESDSVLLYGELCLEHTAASSDKGTKESKSGTPLQIIFLQNIMELTDRREMFESDECHFKFLIRLYWLRCRIFLEKNQTNLAISCLNDVLACYELFPQYETTVIQLKNCRKHNTISKAFAEDFLAFQSRKRSLAEVVRLYEDESYQELTAILKDTFTSTQNTVSNYFKAQESELVDRQTQLAMLINGLYQLNEYKECIYWLETCCYEVVQKSCIQSTEEEVETWMVTFDRFLIAIEDCLKLGKLTVTESLPQNRVSRFVQTLCHAICKELEDSDRPPCPARPWILLNTILIGLEKQPGEAVEEDMEEDDDENDIPSSILILFTAHEYLGRREWCNCNESILLYLIMDQVIPRMRNPDWSSFRETIQQHLEQVIYCLYSHPNKKSKARYLTDHNVNCIPLTWQRGIQLFDLFRPDEIPAYDSLRINLISSETEVLFRRIAALIPDDKDPAQLSDKMTDFIVGKRNDVPLASVKLPESVQDLFYILGDYYFKTHEFAKAVNYLLMDLCANPDRVDSWASMALARASLLEQQLNSCDPLKDEEFLQSALSALRCYEHCLQLDNKQCALWIEYGSFLYTIHSFCSQRMKSESFNLSLEQFEELESTKNKMLETAKQAFVNANLIWYEVKEENERQDERWLHHYMLGKICEKNDDFSYLDHYEKAAELLYENEAEYPTKVGYTTPQTLAIEALEVYYRVHVCIIKNLELNEGKTLDPKIRQRFSKHLNNCATGPFAKQVSKGDLAKIKAKELETSQREKRLEEVKAVMNDIIAKIEVEAGSEEKVKQEALVVKLDATVEEEPMELAVYSKPLDESSIKKENANEYESIDVESGVEADQEKVPDVTDVTVKIEDLYRDQEKVECLATETEESKQEVQAQEISTGDRTDTGGGDPPPDKYYQCFVDTTEQQTSKTKKKRLTSHGSVTSSSCESEPVKFEDESSSSSTSSESSASSQSSSSSSSGSSHSKSDATNKETSKATDEEDKQSDIDKEKVTVEKKSEPEENKQEPKIKGEEKCSQSESTMLMKCLNAFETCALRFPQHYKSVYRLAHFYFRSKEHKDIGKCRDLLLGRYQTANGTIPGLFAERKNTNFFNGIWRIPAGDVDRPGSFASHMSRSVLLLMEVLRDLKDHKMLLEICLQLRKTPEPDKKYLRENERNQLSKQACDLVIQILRKNIKDSSVMTLPMVLDCYRCYQKIQKHYNHKESVYADILLEAFKRLGKGDKCTLEQALRFCQSEVSSVKPKIPKNLGPNLTPRPMKPKKQEKKKLTPKPQITAKAVQKTPKPRKMGEGRKNAPMNILPPNVLLDPTFWSSIMKPPGELKASPDSLTKSGVAGVQMYAELLRSAAMTSKQREQIDKKIVDQTAMKNALDQFKFDMSQKMTGDSSKSSTLPGYYPPFPNTPSDFSGKQMANAFWGTSLPSSLFGSFPNPKKSKPKMMKSLLKPPVPKQDPHSKPEEPKTKTNFNIEDILAKPNITVTKTSSSAAVCSATGSSGLMKSIEDKIKSISKEVNVTKFTPSQALNLSSSSRKNVTESAMKRSHPETATESIATIKKICREQPSNTKKEKIEVVVIDD
ncbi:hypothetical protein RUM43_013056 [Polyplax serrata]|uniref:Calcineurin-binding protein cabin-1 n=1 Tax=Polyplax serrata TaxID=468196 RepID=A0AAN8RZZ3_POLSC